MENQEEVIELTKPKRNTKKKIVSIETPSTPPVEVASIPPVSVPIPKEEPNALYAEHKGGRHLSQLAETIPKKTVRKKKQPTIIISNTPVLADNVVLPAKTEPKTLSVEEYNRFMDIFQQLTKGLPNAQTEKVEPAQASIPVEQETSKTRGRPKKNVEEQVQPQQELVQRIDEIQKRISNSKVKKTKNENDFLRQKLAELEDELAEIEASTEPITKSRTPKQKTVKVPRDRVEIIAQGAPQLPKQLPLRQLINSFGF
jgi:BMFP domain-containing protein YqiC